MASRHFEKAAEKRLNERHGGGIRGLAKAVRSIPIKNDERAMSRLILSAIEGPTNSASHGLVDASNSASKAGDTDRARELMLRAAGLKEELADMYIGREKRTIFDAHSDTEHTVSYLDNAARLFEKAGDTESVERVNATKDQVLRDDRIAGLKVAVRIIGNNADPEVREFLNGALKRESQNTAPIS